jgi:4-diphosphocytidyl-2-C-methyl-D-erythritol kinase
VRPPLPGRTVRVRAPGKINVSFRVGPRRPDGYHAVASLYLAVSLFEEVSATSVPGTDVTVSIATAAQHSPAVADIPLDDRNLAVRAARLMAEVSEHAGGVHLELTKRVPVAGGMGGGSADAAATLLACDELWNSGLSREELAHLAAELGADVPFALLGGAAVGLGVGDQLTPALAPNQLHWVLVQSDAGLSTPAVYAQLDRLREAAGTKPDEPRALDPDVLSALRAGDAKALARVLGNDLEPASIALAPHLAGVLADGAELGALASLVSGSGPTIALLAEGEDEAYALADAMDARGHQSLPVHGPVHGAKVIGDITR